MRRRVRIGEVKTRLLDILLIIFSMVAIVGGVGFMVFIVVGFSEFHATPFLEFLVLFSLGLVGFRVWRKAINA